MQEKGEGIKYRRLAGAGKEKSKPVSTNRYREKREGENIVSESGEGGSCTRSDGELGEKGGGRRA